jgi:hypothetical protein
MSLIRYFLNLTLLATLNGCGEAYLKSNSTPAFAEGYKEGCDNGTARASNQTGQFSRNDARYNSEPEYARGWLAGNRECDGSNFHANPNNTLEQIDIDGPSMYDM